MDEPGGASEPAGQETRPAHVLIVDDEPPLMTALCDTLRDSGYETTGFTDPLQALEAIQQNHYDLLLTDLMMPGIDGIALLRAAQEKDPNMVAIVVTGAGSVSTAVEAMKAGAFDYILKPFKLSAILPVLARAFEMRRLRLDNAALQQSVRKRTAELEEANKELEAFAYSIAHDLRAPLRAICGFSDILLRDYIDQMPDDAKPLLKHVTNSGKEMQQLIDDLLRLSRLGRQRLAMRPVSVASVVIEVLHELRAEQEARGIEVRVGDLPEAVGDPALLKQVFVNLFSNAFKFTRDVGQPIVEVGSQGADGEVVYYVRDNGAGFDMRYANRLFGVFQRLHSKREFEGTGIGLSIVSRVIRRHGGRVWAEAEPGKGATFFFTIR